MAGFESAYVALSRRSSMCRCTTDNRQGWTDAINNAVQKNCPRCESRNRTGGHECRAAVQYGAELRDGGGRAVSVRRLAGRQSCQFYAGKYPQLCTAGFDRNASQLVSG